MTSQHITLAGGLITGRGRSLNPFVILEDATGFISFAEQVFDATEVADARTPTPAGRLIHAELQVGDSLLLLADAQEGWGTHPCSRSGCLTSKRCSPVPSSGVLTS